MVVAPFPLSARPVEKKRDIGDAEPKSSVVLSNRGPRGRRATSAVLFIAGKSESQFPIKPEGGKGGKPLLP